MKYIVQFSLGGGSAEVAKLIVDQHGVDSTILLTADTLVEDSDNWRFGREVHAHIGKPRWVVVTDGRTPMEVGRDEGIIPNNRMAVCSKRLKREICRDWVERRFQPDEVELSVGFDWTEDSRFAPVVEGWAPYPVTFPLVEAMTDKADILINWRRRGIKTPRLYDEGFPHANCGGACVRGGQKQWRRVLIKRPETYRYWEDEEEKSRAQVGDFAILRDRRDINGDGGKVKPLPLREFRRRLGVSWDDYDPEDGDVCGCDPYA